MFTGPFSFLFLAEPLPFTPAGGKSFIMGSDDMLESVLGLGDLADLTVSNDEAEYSYDVSMSQTAPLFYSSINKL